MRLARLSLAILTLSGNPASATDVCEALDSDEVVTVTLSGVLSFENEEFYISDGGCKMVISLPDEKKNACPTGVEVIVTGEVDYDFGFMVDDLILYADEITCP